MNTTGKGRNPLHRRERTEKQKKRRLILALAVIAAALLTVIIPGRPQRPDGPDGREQAEERMDACLDSLLDALGCRRHTVTATGPAEKRETGWQEFRRERLRQLTLAASALTAAGDTARAAEALRLAGELERTADGATRTAWMRWVEYRDGKGRTQTILQEIGDGGCRARSTGRKH